MKQLSSLHMVPRYPAAPPATLLRLPEGLFGLQTASGSLFPAYTPPRTLFCLHEPIPEVHEPIRTLAKTSESPSEATPPRYESSPLTQALPEASSPNTTPSGSTSSGRTSLLRAQTSCTKPSASRIDLSDQSGNLQPPKSLKMLSHHSPTLDI
jgi:hypothetical protein